MPQHTKQTSSELIKLLQASKDPAFVLNELWEFIFVNSAFLEQTDLELENVLGQKVSYQTQSLFDQNDDWIQSLSPPPQVYHGEVAQGQVPWRAATEDFVTRTCLFQPIQSEIGDTIGVIGFVGEVLSEAEHSQSKLIDLNSDELHDRLLQIRKALSRRFHIGALIGDTELMRKVREQADLAALSDTSVLIIGPVGSGREHLARTIHCESGITEDPSFFPLDCRTLNEDLISSTIYALTVSLTEQPEEKCILFLQDVDLLPLLSQSEIAKQLSLAKNSIRVIATAQTAIDQLVSEKKFDLSLYNLLSTITIHLPALKERKEDIGLLTQFFLERLNERQIRQFSGFDAEALDALVNYDWPRNVTQLAEVVRESAQNTKGPMIRKADLPSELTLAFDAALYPLRRDEPINLDNYLRRIETELIERALKRAKGNKTQAAKLLGINRQKFYRKLVQLGLESEDVVIFEEDTDA